MLGPLYHHADLLALILIVMNSAHIFTNAILKNMKNMKNNMKFYISGKIGKEDPSPETLAKFKKAEDMLRSRGHDVSGLGRHAESLAQAADYDTSFYQEIMLLDLVQLAQCDAVLVLEDWHNSPESKPELMLAMALQKPIYREAPNGRLFPVKFDVRMIIEYQNPNKALTVGEVVKKLMNFSLDTPMVMSADFMLGEPFVQSFDRQIHGPIYEVRANDDLRVNSGMTAVLDAYLNCTINFD